MLTIFTAHQKFLHFHGQNGARLCRDQSLYNTGPSKRSLLITILSPILFNAPDVHLRALGDIWVDDIIGHVPWTDFMTKLTNDWKEFTLYVCVMCLGSKQICLSGLVRQRSCSMPMLHFWQFRVSTPITQTVLVLRFLAMDLLSSVLAASFSVFCLNGRIGQKTESRLKLR